MFFSGRQGIGQVADDQVVDIFEYPASRFRSFRDLTCDAVPDPVTDRCGYAVPQVIPVQDILAITECSAVRNGQAGSDNIQIIADDVRDNQGNNISPICMAAELPTLDPGKMLSNRINFMDICPAGQLAQCHRLFGCQGDTVGKGRCQGGSSPGHHT